VAPTVALILICPPIMFERIGKLTIALILEEMLAVI
jgi:hypothetical protein